MAWVPIVVGIKPARYFPKCNHIRVIYRSGDKEMLLDNIHIKDAKAKINMHGLEWSAYMWKNEDGLSDWERLDEPRKDQRSGVAGCRRVLLFN